MKLAIISSAPFIQEDEQYFGYGPYVNELAIWASNVDEVAVCCPFWDDRQNLLVSKVSFPVSRFFKVVEFNIKSVMQISNALWHAPQNFYQIYSAMAWADHIHLRCPGNIGLMGCLVQILFPKKKKTAKYAGNWDPKAKQPFAYRLQKWILNNTFLTRNMQVMVYGKWEGSSPNISPFFTATYYESDKVDTPIRNVNNQIRCIFAGTLSEGKRPLYAVKLIKKLAESGIDTTLEIYGDGSERETLERFIMSNQLQNVVKIHGNQSADVLKTAYQHSHFVILPSKSEGWPKVIAEAMFWGCVPLSTAVSCVPYMIGNGARGMILQLSEDKDLQQILDLIHDPKRYSAMAHEAMIWSRNYTMDFFEREIKRLLHG